VETTAHPTTPEGGVAVETEALKALEFYTENYEQQIFPGLGMPNRQIVLGTKPFVCRYCDGKPPERTFRKRAHAVSELLGNRVIKSRYECDQCNERFSAFEDDLGKMTLPFRNMGGVAGKNGVPTLLSASGEAKSKSRMEFKEGTLHMSHPSEDNSIVVDEVAKTGTFSYSVQPYRPLGAYKALCKSAFALLQPNELAHFNELKQWLLQDDVTTSRVYDDGCYVCWRTFVPAFRAFPQPLVILLRRKAKIDAPYMSLFVAFGNLSYQIFLPCPAQDGHLLGKNIELLTYPHIYRLQPWKASGPISYEQIDLSSPERTKAASGTLGWRYENRIKVEAECTL
jgi:hypothetical protein